MLKVAAYCRVSTDKDDQLNSLENQKNYFDRYITSNPDWEFIDTYVDEGITYGQKAKSQQTPMNTAFVGFSWAHQIHQIIHTQ